MSNTGQALLEATLGIVRSLIAKYSRILLRLAIRGERRELPQRHRGNFLSEVDRRVHFEYLTRLSEVLPSFVYASEEGEPTIFPQRQSEWPPYLVIVDPIDTSELAVRGLCGYTHVSIYSLEYQSPVVSVVGDMFHEVQLFCAFGSPESEHSARFVTRAGKTFPLRASREKNLSRALLTNYMMVPGERFGKLVHQRNLLRALSRPDRGGEARGRVGVDFGSVGLCHIAAGFTDAMIEIAKGFYIWDLFPGQHILRAAGGVVTSLDGSPLSLNLRINSLSDVQKAMKRRVRFVAAGQPALLRSIVRSLR